MGNSYNEKLNNFYFSHNITMVIKSRMRWVEYAAHKEMRNAYKTLDRDINRRGKLNEQEDMEWIHVTRGFYKQSSAPIHSTKDREFVD